MIKSILFFLLLLNTVSLFSQFPVNVNVDSKGQLYLTPNTVQGAKYTIRVEGTFSIWPQFQDCRGFDGAYVYEAPKEEIDELRWPPEEIEVLGNKIEILKLPKWVGDPTLYQFPPPNISKPVIELSLEKQKGFRINGKSLPDSGFNSDHNYEVELIGDGMPFTLQIIDSNYSILEGKTIPRYDDNCGSLAVYIEEYIENDSTLVLDICDDFFLDSKYHLDANIYFDSHSIDTIENLISLGYNGSLSFDNRVFEQIATNCKYSKVSSEIHFLIDNSGSMLAGESPVDTIKRIDAAKNTILSIFDLLDQNDRVSITSFNESAMLIFGLGDVTKDNYTIIEDKINRIIAGYQSDVLNGLELLQTQVKDLTPKI